MDEEGSLSYCGSDSPTQLKSRWDQRLSKRKLLLVCWTRLGAFPVFGLELKLLGCLPETGGCCPWDGNWTSWFSHCLHRTPNKSSFQEGGRLVTIESIELGRHCYGNVTWLVTLCLQLGSKLGRVGLGYLEPRPTLSHSHPLGKSLLPKSCTAKTQPPNRKRCTNAWALGDGLMVQIKHHLLKSVSCCLLILGLAAFVTSWANSLWCTFVSVCIPILLSLMEDH